jgi:hypothetical protein
MIATAAHWDGFETAAATFAATAADALTEGLRPLAFVSPVSARTPDIDDVWHRGLRARDPEGVLTAQRRAERRQRVRAIARAGLAPRRFAYRFYGEPSDTLLVCSAVVGREASPGRWETAYVPTGSRDAVLVFGHEDAVGSGATPVAHLSPARKVAISRALLAAGSTARASLSCTAIEADMLQSVWDRWAAGMLWLHDFYLGGVLARTFDQIRPAKVGCAHEMHAYARIVWQAAREARACTHAMQHSGVASGKRWYFPHPLERRGGLATPDVMYAYSEHAIALLRQGLPDAEFRLGGSARFAKWRDVGESQGGGSGVLVVGALARFDNDVVLDAAERLVSERVHPAVRVRLHPHADLSTGARTWLSSAEKDGRVRVSRGIPLREDIENAEVVAGCGTTVLEEALLLGRPVLHLVDPDHVEYVDLEGVPGVHAVQRSRVRAADVAVAATLAPRRAFMRDRLGLDKPLVDYTRLFLKTVPDGSSEGGIDGRARDAEVGGCD